jgi:hypothetical protein
MKKIFSILLVVCSTCIFAESAPVFEETDEQAEFYAYGTFTSEEPIFEEDLETRTGQGTANESESAKNLLRSKNPLSTKRKNTCNVREYPLKQANYVNWRRYKANFGIEKVFARFPHSPTITQTSTLLTAYAYDNIISYSLNGYYPPVSHIDALLWFDEVLCSVDHYPFNLLSNSIFQASNGDWVLDYVAHDYIQNLIVKARAIVTPFNAYTIQCVKPNGARDHFDYFLESFWIRCDCES